MVRIQKGGVGLGIYNEFTFGHIESRVPMEHSGRDVERDVGCTGWGLMKGI